MVFSCTFDKSLFQSVICSAVGVWVWSEQNYAYSDQQDTEQVQRVEGEPVRRRCAMEASRNFQGCEDLGAEKHGRTDRGDDTRRKSENGQSGEQEKIDQNENAELNDKTTPHK